MNDYKGIVPYLFYDDAEAAMQWYARVFGFEERGRWPNAEGKIQNAEMRVGNTELWLDGGGKRTDTDERPTWIGIWVDDVDAVHARIQAAGVDCEAVEDKPYGVRTFNVADGMGYLWGFMRRIP